MPTIFLAEGAQQPVVDADERIYKNIKPFGDVLDLAKESRAGCRCARDLEVLVGIQAHDRLETFRLLAAKPRFGFLVGLHEAKRVDHAVVVDGNYGVIVDSEEHTVLALSAGILERCSGEGRQSGG